MKTLFITTLLAGTIVFAQTTPPTPPPTNPAPTDPQTPPTDPTTKPPVPVFKTLKEGMKDMSSKLKIIAMQANDPTKNGESEKLSLDLMASITACKVLIPDTVNDQASKDLYEKMMDDTMAIVKDLADAFSKNDNTKANELLVKLSQVKKDGHNEFK